MAVYQLIEQYSHILIISKTILGVCLLTRSFGFTLFLMRIRSQQLLFTTTPYFLPPGLLGVCSIPGEQKKRSWNPDTQLFKHGQSRFLMFSRHEGISLMFVLINLAFFSFAQSICLHISPRVKIEQQSHTRCSCISLHVYLKGNPFKGSSSYQANMWEKKMEPERLK